MATLDLFKGRKPHTLVLEVGGKSKEFLIPVAYTVEEIERLLEIQIDIDRIAALPTVADDSVNEKRINEFFDYIFNQLLVLFNRYQTDIELEDLKKMLSREDAQKIIAFHASEQILYTTGDEKSDSKKTKKKVPKEN